MIMTASMNLVQSKPSVVGWLDDLNDKKAADDCDKDSDCPEDDLCGVLVHTANDLSVSDAFASADYSVQKCVNYKILKDHQNDPCPQEGKVIQFSERLTRNSFTITAFCLGVEQSYGQNSYFNGALSDSSCIS